MFPTLILFLLGLIFGSFFNVVGIRLPENKSFIDNRSQCPTCQKKLAWYELIPVLSFVLQQGKCNQCRSTISILYPITELITAFLCGFSYHMIGNDYELVTAYILFSLLMIVFVTDLTYMIIPNRLLLFFLPVFVIIRLLDPLDPWWSSIAGLLIILFIVAIIIVVSKGGMGAGDMKLLGLLGIILGYQKVMLAFILSCLSGGVIGIILIVFNKLDQKQPIPFGPYIIFATLLSYFYGDFILNWYFNVV